MDQGQVTIPSKTIGYQMKMPKNILVKEVRRGVQLTHIGDYKKIDKKKRQWYCGVWRIKYKA